MKSSVLILAAAIFAAGCVSNPGTETTQRETLVDASGRVTGYQERIDGRMIMFDAQGNRTGERWLDNRNDGANPGNKGIAVTVEPVGGSK